MGIVGTRKPDPWAARWTRSLARELVMRGITVVSGGALGIDTEAHQGALEGCGRTITVLGSGMDHLAPASNRALFYEVAGAGALITEFDDDVPPNKWTYPRRNRIVAGRSDAVVVVQAAERSGSLITARLAQKFQIPLGVVPGNGGDSKSRGSNDLIKQGARLVESVDDVLALMGQSMEQIQLSLPVMQTPDENPSSRAPVDLPGDEQTVFDLLADRTMHIDDRAVAVQMEGGQGSAALVSLEVAGGSGDRGGKCFARSSGS